jgi:hypothetical protein
MECLPAGFYITTVETGGTIIGHKLERSVDALKNHRTTITLPACTAHPQPGSHFHSNRPVGTPVTLTRRFGFGLADAASQRPARVRLHEAYAAVGGAAIQPKLIFCTTGLIVAKGKSKTPHVLACIIVKCRSPREYGNV